MSDRRVSIPTGDGMCDATIHAPSGVGSWPAVIMYPDAGGTRPTFEAMAQHLAEMGYTVVLPNLYYRFGDVEPLDLGTVFTDPRERSRLMERSSQLTCDLVSRDTEAILAFLAGQPAVRGTRIGTVGCCRGGSFALTAAGRFPERVAAAASFHGGHIASTAADSPHHLAQSMKAKLYVAGAESDPTFDAEEFERLSAALRDADVEHMLVTYPAAHGFAVTDNPTFDQEASDRHWQALRDLYASALSVEL